MVQVLDDRSHNLIIFVGFPQVLMVVQNIIHDFNLYSLWSIRSRIYTDVYNRNCVKTHFGHWCNESTRPRPISSPLTERLVRRGIQVGVRRKL